MNYDDIIISEETKEEVYNYLEKISLFDSMDVKIQPSSYALRNYSDPSKYIFSIEFFKDSNLYSADGIVKIEENGYNFVYSTSVDYLVKSDSFTVEDVVKRKTTYAAKETIETKEFDKEIFFTNKTYKKN